MILPRLLQLIFVIFGLLCLVPPSCQAQSSSRQLKTDEGKCLSFGKRNAMLKPCSDNDPNQMIHMQKLNSTLLVIHDSQGQKVMCYDTIFKKVRIFNIKRLVKNNYRGNPGEVVEATRTRRKFECGIYEEVQGDGHVYLRFGNTGADYMVWKTNNMIVKAKDMFCSYQESQETQNIRHNNSKNSRRSRERRYRSTSVENRVSAEGSRIVRRSVSGERRITRTQQLERRAERRQKRRREGSPERRHHRRPNSERRRRKHKKKCRARERAKFKQFMYYNRPPL